MSQRENAPALCGFLNILKPPGMTSAQVVGFAKRILKGTKVGHAGTLDPEAAGVLPIMVGKATRLFDYMQEKEKAYVAEIAFGCSTDTRDAQGAVEEASTAYPDKQAVEEALAGFVGDIWQKPPIYSALKQDGRRLYELARVGKVAEIPARETTVHELSLIEMTEPNGALISVRCAKGFYVRSLCHDLGQALGYPAHMRFLLRTQSGIFTLKTAQTLEDLEKAAQENRLEEWMIPPEAVLWHLPQAEVPKSLQAAFANGSRLNWGAFPGLHESSAADGAPAALWVNGRLTAIGARQGDEVKIRTWLGS